MPSVRQISRTTARRLAVTKQRLVPHGDSLLDVVRALGCVQLDPIRAVERTHWLVLWSRLGNFDRTEFERNMWEENAFFEYWAHAASIVLTEDYPVHYLEMKNWRNPNGKSQWARRQREMIKEHAALRQHMLDRLRAEGPLPSRVFDDDRVGKVSFTGWTSPRLISRMFDHMWSAGLVMVAGRQGNQRLWDVTDRVLPEWAPRHELTPEEVTHRAAQVAIQALGVATETQIKRHFTRGRYPHLGKVLKRLKKSSTIQQVEVVDGNGDVLWNQPAYIHQSDLPLLDAIEAGDWQTRTTLLSPFDNLICDRDRTTQLWDFDFRIEIYVPKDKRQYGYYVLPILHGDKLIGRIDPQMDRKTGTLWLNNVYSEPGAPDDAETVAGIRSAIDSLAAFLEAEDVKFNGNIPVEWAQLAM
jgi:uncharacterized protein YcaQ